MQSDGYEMPANPESPYLSGAYYSPLPNYAYQQVLRGYTNVADSETDVVGIASRELAILLLIVVLLLFLSTVTLYAVKRCYIRFITLPAISLVYGGFTAPAAPFQTQGNFSFVFPYLNRFIRRKHYPV